jgi:hypothetical protein
MKKVNKDVKEFVGKMSDIAMRTSQRVSNKKDLLIVDAINHAIGNKNWDIDDPQIIARGAMEVFDDDISVFVFDKKQMLYFEEPRTMKYDKKNSSMIESVFSYCELYKLEDVEGK